MLERHVKNLLHTPLHINQFKQIHAKIILAYSLHLIPLFTRKLLTLPSFIHYARKVFGQIPQPDQTLYNSIISAHSKLSLHKHTIAIFISMRHSDAHIDDYTVPPLLKSCSSLPELGKQVHCLAAIYGLDSTVYVQTALIDFYAKIGDVGSAKKVFDEIVVKDVVCYNCLISGYSKSDDVITARKLFDEMSEKTVASWNSVISCYANNGDFVEGFRIFERMQVEGFCANEYTVVTVLKICAKLGDLELGSRVKAFIDDNKLRTNVKVSTSLLEMFVKCGAVDEARREFDQMVDRDVFAWSAMIAGYSQNGRYSATLELFEVMKSEQVEPNEIIIVNVLSACAQLSSVEAGESISNYVESHGLDSSLNVAAALLGMYSRCGNIERACQVFRKLPEKDVVTWNSMIMGLAINGFAKDAIAHYEKLKETKVKPDEITFVMLLTACAHAGLLEAGLEFFEAMRLEYGISPEIEHYACIVDLYCRLGKLKPAYEFICQMELQPNAVIWGTLLSACRIHMNVELAEISVNKLVELEPGNSGNYILLSNMYASAGRWQEALRVRSLMRGKKLQKTAAYSWIELENMVHKFLVCDTSHPAREDVYNTVGGLALNSSRTSYEFYSDIEV